MSRLADGQLLNEVARSGSKECFEELVQRHGAMVLGACRRLLGNVQDAEDAAQAVFLLLWQKASKLCGRATVAGWLHEVTRKVCRNARRAREIRQKYERDAAGRNELAYDENAVWHELKDVLDEALAGLPEKYRLPIILFHLEGRSLDEIAALLHTKSSTVGTRLSRARELLRSRLARLGIALSAASLAATLAANASAAATPAAFVSTSTQAASLFAAGKLTAEGILSAKTAALAKGVSKMLTLAKLKVAAVVVAGSTVVASGVALSQAPEPVPASPKIQAVTQAYEAGRRQVRNLVIEFRVQGKPIADAATGERLERDPDRLLQDETITFVADSTGFVWRVQDHGATARNVRETTRWRERIFKFEPDKARLIDYRLRDEEFRTSGSAFVYPDEEVNSHVPVGYVGATGYALGVPLVEEWGFPSENSCIPQIFNRYPFRDAPEETVDGARCVVLEAPGRHKMWLDPSRGYAVRKREFFWDGVRAGLVECRDFQRVAGTQPAVYLPKLVVWTNFGGEGNTLAISESHYVLQRVEINRPQRSDLMNLQIEPGTLVWDYTKQPIGPDGEPIAGQGVAYQQPETAEEAPAVIRTAQESAGTSLAQARRQRTWTVTAVVLVSLCVAAGGVVLFRRWRRG